MITTFFVKLPKKYFICLAKKLSVILNTRSRNAVFFKDFDFNKYGLHGDHPQAWKFVAEKLSLREKIPFFEKINFLLKRFHK